MNTDIQASIFIYVEITADLIKFKEYTNYINKIYIKKPKYRYVYDVLL